VSKKLNPPANQKTRIKTRLSKEINILIIPAIKQVAFFYHNEYFLNPPAFGIPPDRGIGFRLSDLLILF